MNAGRILVVDDEADIRRLLQEILSEEGFVVEVAGNGEQAREVWARHVPDLVLLDIWMPDVDGITLLRELLSNPADVCPVVMMSGHGTVESAVEATRVGAFDFIEKPLSLSKLLLTVNRALAARREAGDARAGGVLAAAPFGRSRVMQQLRTELARLAAYREPLLLIGEAGTEPEALARFIHQSGPRAEAPFVSANSRTLTEQHAAELLAGSGNGHIGLIEQARGGTLYLGDVEDLPEAAQRLLAGVLEGGALPGSGPAATLDVRVIGFARPGIDARSGASGLGRDLHALLAALPLHVPALRDYAEDIPDLLRHCVDQMTATGQLKFRRFTVAAQNRLRNYPWPDNLRELRALVRRLLLRGGAEEISLEEVERELAAPVSAEASLVKQDLLAMPLREAREHFERAYLTQQLQLCGGKVGQLAKRVGMERTHLYRKLRSLGIEIAQGAEE
jgi:DNA-binding NtrC family response regulator